MTTGADREDSPLEVQPGLQANAIGFVDALAIGLNATSPAYSLAAVLGPIVVLVGIAAPSVLIVAFIPMLLIASAFYFLNRVDADCGTTFSWVTRAMGPWFGWMGGWAIAMTGVLVVGSLADVAIKFLLLTVGLDEAAENQLLVLALSIALIVAMTWLCVTGTEASAKVQNILTLAQVAALLVFIVVAIYKALTGMGAPDVPGLSWEWLNPLAAGPAALSAGLLLGVFAYWGWESAVNLNEETTDSASTPGIAAIVSTLVLVMTYVGTAIAVLLLMGPAFMAERAGDEEMAFADVAVEALGGWSWILLLAVSTSAIASTQTTIIPASRTALSMARRGALPAYFGRISTRHRTPAVATWWVAIIGIVWFVIVRTISDNALFDSLSALSLLIAFYYALTGFACALYYRKLLLSSVKAFLLIGVGPVVGGAALVWLLVLSVRDMSDPENSYSGISWLGLGPPLVIGIIMFGVGIIMMIAMRVAGTPFWDERAGVVDPDLVPASEGGTAP
ncbi:MAG TPA: amino acid transporter [Actinobacteria bacterium]|nr:amino acid transporter [Actinomycetota bacterium]